MSTAFLIIDGQMSFMDGPSQGALAVPGAWDDMNRLAALLESEITSFDMLVLTLDQHNSHDISHPNWFEDRQGKHPLPFTLITAQDMEDNRWTTSDPAARETTLTYLRALEDRGRYIHTIWPEHCVIGTQGACLQPALAAAVHGWERSRHRTAHWIMKGMDPHVEHYSGFAAEVANPHNPTHEVMGARHVATLARHDTIHVAGEASSHCVKATLEDLIVGLGALGDPTPERRLVIHRDMMSPVPAIPNGPDFPSIAHAFFTDLEVRGARFAPG